LSLSPTHSNFFRAGLLLLFLLSLPPGGPALPVAAAQISEADFARSRDEMIERDLRGRGIKNERVLEAMRLVPRHRFVPEEQRPAAYQDRPLAIGDGQTISQPYVVALMSELLDLKGGEKVLEIGAGSGYQAAVLSRLAEGVYTIEIIPSLAARAQETLTRLGYRNISVKTGDGFFGWEEKGPFDAILITAAAEKIPEPLWRQLREGGRLVMPLGEPRGNQQLVRVRKVGGKQQIENVTAVVFVPMTGAVERQGR
jgi:protein-L-isoaspartate(D-aspartate) O-methyltransferase